MGLELGHVSAIFRYPIKSMAVGVLFDRPGPRPASYKSSFDSGFNQEHSREELVSYRFNLCLGGRDGCFVVWGPSAECAASQASGSYPDGESEALPNQCGRLASRPALFCHRDSEATQERLSPCHSGGIRS